MSFGNIMPSESNKFALRHKVRVGLIGADIQMSKSPALHMREASLHGLDYSYELIDLTLRGVAVDHLPDLLSEVEDRGFAGVNITHPCKQIVLPLLTRLADDARSLGAVNTVVFHDGERVGHNTDCSGFYENFRQGLPDVTRDRALLLGAGGAGAAVAHAALSLGMGHLLISDQDASRAESLARSLNEQFAPGRASATGDIEAAMQAADGLIHATPTGMRNHPGLPLDGALIESRHWVADIVYMPLVTPLLALARDRGCRTLDGGGMVVYQAAGALRLFAGIEPDAARMRRHFSELVGADAAPA
ncbi:shikimate dehydrogenase [Mesorhizobium sp. M9A.F.Ca.ET.002.03.1.2]|nr:shikimate dehydrogenase [Mesorhizobium sp. M9A.F.Ca.ET.002.03.1.2]